MKLKTSVILLLLSIFSVYFLCPVLCPTLRAESCSVFIIGQSESQVTVSVSQGADTHSSESTCCRTGNRKTTPDGDTDEGNDNCCFDHLGIFKTSEYQRTFQTLEQPFPSVAVIAFSVEINTFPAHFTVVLDRHLDSTLDPPSYQISPRAPPFSLA
ncbi:MAG: hypothetical protein OXT74_03595 [Candidatus Poribacteria bacterium]|nr:hypothetical protein [Candidatus Poribacteria bacterium]